MKNFPKLFPKHIVKVVIEEKMHSMRPKKENIADDNDVPVFGIVEGKNTGQ